MRMKVWIFASTAASVGSLLPIITGLLIFIVVEYCITFYFMYMK